MTEFRGEGLRFIGAAIAEVLRRKKAGSITGCLDVGTGV